MFQNYNRNDEQNPIQKKRRIYYTRVPRYFMYDAKNR